MTGRFLTHQGMVWVDSRGNLVEKKEDKEAGETKDGGDPVGGGEQKADGGGQQATAAQVQTAALWKRVNPGCMLCYTDLPNSTYTRNFTFDEKNNTYIQDEKDWTYHFRKTDFSEYSEAAVKHKMTLTN